MKKMKYESVNEVRFSGIFTRNHFRDYENRKEGCVACSLGDETKFFTVVMFRDRNTGRFPWEDLFEGGKKVVFRGRYHLHRNKTTGRVYEEIQVSEMHENVPREVEVPDGEPQEATARQRRDGGYRREEGDRTRRRPYNPDFSKAAGLEPVPEGLFDDEG